MTAGLKCMVLKDESMAINNCDDGVVIIRLQLP